LTRPWLSVIVPTRNGGRLVRRALDSVAAEGDDGVEVIAVDDGSTDETLAVLETCRRSLNLVIERRKVGNWVANTNLGLERASADLACFLHQDDSWLPGRLAAVRDRLAGTSSAGLLLHACQFVAADGRPVGRWTGPLPPDRPSMPATTVGHLLVQNFVGIPGAVFRRSLALECGGLDESLWYTADWDFWLKLASSTDTMYLPRPLATFRVHAASLTATRSRSIPEFRDQLESVFARHAARWQEPDESTRRSVGRAARASIEINVALASAYHRLPFERGRLLSALGTLRPSDWARLWRDARLRERIASRLRAGLRPTPCR
jgi:GT2 family glycosyltransferase